MEVWTEWEAEVDKGTDGNEVTSWEDRVHGRKTWGFIHADIETPRARTGEQPQPNEGEAPKMPNTAHRSRERKAWSRCWTWHRGARGGTEGTGYGVGFRAGISGKKEEEGSRSMRMQRGGPPCSHAHSVRAGREEAASVWGTAGVAVLRQSWVPGTRR